MSDSLAVVHDAIVTGCVSLELAAQPQDIPADGLVATLRAQAGQLLATSASVGADRPVIIADRWLAGRTMAAAGAVEIAVHGWDIAEACHRRRPIPPGLATSILAVVPLVVTEVTRGVQFSVPVAPAPQATPGDRLVALLGRDPAASLSKA
ncbi:MAG TPA: maleylpyruvate isomerase N-terminal domain-containing protein [Streptosporangiaceae bacterium]